MRTSALLRAVFALIGFTAVLAQIVLMRELIVVFVGNEMSLGVMLACWLFWTAAGSSFLGHWAARTPQPRRLMAGLESLVALVLPLTIAAVRLSRTFLQTVPGELLGPGLMFLTSLVALSLFCMLCGGLFAVGSRLYAEAAGISTAMGTGSVYLLEAVGSGVGGLLASLVLIRYLDPLALALLLSLLNLLAAAWLLIESAKHRRVVMAAVTAAFLIFVFPFAAPWLEATSLARLWRGFHLVGVRNSIYGNLAVVETRATRSLFENGVPLFHVPDPATAEEAVHFALLEHPSPHSLLLIGGGVNGSLAQALQHPSLERVDYVELDPAILGVARKYFFSEWGPFETDPRVHLHNLDGRLFLKTTRSTFDVIVVNLPEPQTAQLNRFYTAEFFRELEAKLEPGGIFSFQLRAGQDYISPELADFLRCVDNTLRTVFPEVAAIPGDTVHFFAARQPGILTTDSQTLLERLRARHLRTSYIREYYIPFRLAQDRLAELEQQLRPQPQTPINRDFAPIAYYFDVVLWGTQFDARYRELFQLAARLDFPKLALAWSLCLLLLAPLLYMWPPRARRSARCAGFCVAVMGFTLIGLEILLLLAFQAVYGYVYHQLALLIACFMVGMALGSWRGIRHVNKCPPGEIGPDELARLAALQTRAALSPLLLYALAAALAHIKTALGIFAAGQIVFPCLAVLCGLLGGYQFPVASRIYFGVKGAGAKSPGAVYALDLTGACVGAVALSAYLLPVLGFLKTSVLMALLNLAPAALAGLAAWAAPAPQE